MQSRMNHPVYVLPEAMTALQALSAAAEGTGLDRKLVELVNLRASQINGCSVCALMHPRIARKLGETNDRLDTVATWRDAPYFTDAERAALALTESLTRIADSADPVPDAIWDEAARHYDEKQLAGLVTTIAAINVWNRLNVATRQVAGQPW
jgi:AhpD family alkylhydroperoxidase